MTCQCSMLHHGIRRCQNEAVNICVACGPVCADCIRDANCIFGTHKVGITPEPQWEEHLSA